MATDDQGGNPTELSGVTYLGAQSSGQTYSIRRSTGEVLGPFDRDLIAQMIRGAKLSGDEGVSLDRENWAPILSVPEFAAAFDGSDSSGSASKQRALKTVGEETAPSAGPVRTDSMSVPPAIEESIVERSPADTAFGAPSGNWSTIEEPALTEESVAEFQLGEREALSNVAGVRRISGDGASLSGTPPQAESELPTPEGFTHFPHAGTGPSFPTPNSAPQDQTTQESNPPLGFAHPTLSTAQGTLEIPGSPGATQEFEGFSGTQGLEPPPSLTGGRAWGDLPQSAQGVTDLPQTATNLPQSATNLPQSATNLPQSATNLPQSATNLPQSAINLPQSATNLPASTTNLPQSASAGSTQFGTMAMSGLDVDVALGGRTADDPFGVATGDLPASARQSGTSVLDTMAQTDDIWAAPDGVVEQRSETPANPFSPSGGFGTQAMPAQAGTAQRASLATEPISVQEPWAGDGHPILPPSEGESDDFADFFPGGEAAVPDLGTEAEALEPEAEPSASAEADAAPKKNRSKKGSNWGLRIGLMLVLLGVLAFVALGLKWLTGTPPQNPTAPEIDNISSNVPDAPIELPSFDLLTDGSYKGVIEFVDDARQAVGDRGDIDDRAYFLIGSSLLFATHEEHADLPTEMNRVYESLVDGLEGATPLTDLAVGAYLAATASDEAIGALSGVRSGEYAALGNLYSGIYEIQAYQGVEIAIEEEEPDVVADGSGEGSGETEEAPSDEADGEAAEEDDDQAEEIAIEDEEEAPPQAVIVEASRELSDDAAGYFDAAIRANSDLVPAHFWRGWVSLESGDPDAAQSHFENALANNPEHVASEIGVARCLLKQARLADADSRIQRVIDELEALSSSMQRSDTFVVAAEIAISRMQQEIAIESLISALQANPENLHAMRLLGEEYFAAELFPDALEYFGGVEDLGDEAESRIGLAQAQVGLEMFEGARATLEAGMEQFPRDGRFPYWLGNVYEADAEFDLARQYYRQAMQIEPRNVRPLVQLALLSERENMAADALGLLDQAEEANDDNAAMANEIGEMYLRLNETNRAVTAFRTSLNIDGSQPDARINLTEYYLDSGQQARALEQLQIMIGSGVESPRVRYLNARALHGSGDYSRAIEELLVLQESDTDNPDYLFLLGLVHFDDGNYTAARQHFVRAYEESPTLGEAQYYVGRCDIELGGYNEAITSLTDASRRSNSGEYHYWLGVALEKASQRVQALQEFDQAIEDDVAWSLENPEVYSRRGRLYYERGAMRAAYRDLRTVLTLRPTHIEAAWTIGRVHYEERSYSDAIGSFEYSLTLDPDQPVVHYEIALAYLRLEPMAREEAVVHFEAARAAEFGIEEPELFQKLAYVYRDLGRREDAAAALEAFMEHGSLSFDERRETENEVLTLRGR
jgi:tetratricopeptide (TPR) repeat protein